MGWTSYNKFGEVVFSADTLDGYSSDEFVFAAGDTMTGDLITEGAPASGRNFAVRQIGDTGPRVLMTMDASGRGEIGFGGGAGAGDWFLVRTAASVAELATGDKIRDTSDPVHANDLSRKSYVDSAVATGAASVVPTGTILDFAGAAAPSGFLLADGSEVLRATYPDLDTVIGTTYGPYTDGSGGAGTSHMRLPDLRGRVSMGAGTGAGDGASGGAGSAPSGTALTARARGAWGGGETHTLTPAQTPLRSHSHSGTTGNDNVDHSHSGTTGDINQNHTHSGSTGTVSADHAHNVTYAQISNTTVGGGGTRITDLVGGTNIYTTSGITANHVHGFTTGTVSSGHTHNFSTGGRSAFHQHAFTTGNPSVAEANGSPHANVQPFVVLNKIIKT